MNKITCLAGAALSLALAGATLLGTKATALAQSDQPTLLSNDVETPLPDDETNVVPGRLLVKFRAGVSDEKIHDVIRGAGARTTRTIPQIGVQVLQLPSNASPVAMAHAFARKPRSSSPSRIGF
jgi:hypothetical protein